MKMKKSNSFQKVLTVFFIVIAFFWAALFATKTKSGNLNYWYSFLFGLIPLFGGLVGMAKSSIWGGLKSTLGRAIFFISLGLLLWGLGETIWSYYNFFKGVAAPYPSLADLGFGPSIFFWILGTAYLAIASGAWFALKKNKWAKILTIIVPLALLIPSYYIQVKLARGGTLVPESEPPLKLALDIAYPLGDFLALVIASIVFGISYRYFGGYYRKAIVSILFGLAVMYCADSIFAYTTTKETYYNANWGDLLLSIGVFLLSWGVLAFASKPSSSLNKESVDPKGG
jgi:hypothetical protein